MKIFRTFILICTIITFSTVKAQTFTEDKFSINCGCSLVKQSNGQDNNSYQCADKINIIIYRVTVANLSDDLKQSGLTNFDQTFINSYFKAYCQGLKKDNIKYTESTYLNKKAIIYENTMLIGGNSLGAKTIIFLANKRSYTLSVTSAVEEVDKNFTAFIKIFKFLN